MLVLVVSCSDYRISIIHLSPGVKKIFESILFISIVKKNGASYKRVICYQMSFGPDFNLSFSN